MTREGVARIANALLADTSRRRLGPFHDLITKAARACRQLAVDPAGYSDLQLAQFVTDAAQGADLREQQSPQARVAGHLLGAMGELAAEVLAHRTPAGARPC